MELSYLSTLDGRSHILKRRLFLAFFAFLPMSSQADDLLGIVHDQWSAPISGAQLTLFGSYKEWTAVSNNAGEWRFVSLSPGAYYVQASAPGFSTKVLHVDLRNDKELSTISLTPTPSGECAVLGRAEITYKDVTPRKSEQMSVYVRSLSGKPLRARIQILDTKSRGRTNSDGMLLLTVPTQAIRLAVSSVGYATLKTPLIFVRARRSADLRVTLEKAQGRTICQ